MLRILVMRHQKIDKGQPLQNYSLLKRTEEVKWMSLISLNILMNKDFVMSRID
jgi:hypothetical protein